VTHSPVPARSLTLSILPGDLAICRLDARAAVPDWALGGRLFSIIRTADELSVVCPSRRIPHGVRCDKGWRCLKVEGPLDLAETGVLASLAAPLARTGISLFALSTFDTDYLLIKARNLRRAVQALRQAGHRVQSSR